MGEGRSEKQLKQLEGRRELRVVRERGTSTWWLKESHCRRLYGRGMVGIPCKRRAKRPVH